MVDMSFSLDLVAFSMNNCSTYFTYARCIGIIIIIIIMLGVIFRPGRIRTVSSRYFPSVTDHSPDGSTDHNPKD